MRIEGFRTPMEPAARTAGEELSGLLGQSAHYFAYFSISHTFLGDLMDLGTDKRRKMMIVASISDSESKKVIRATCAAGRRTPRGSTY